MKIWFQISLLFISYVCAAQAPMKYSKLKIDLEGKNVQDLTALGLETDHGFFAKDRFLINIFDETELVKIAEAGFNFEIIVDDMKTYYKTRPNKPLEDVHTHHKGLGCDDDGTTPIDDIQTPVNYSEGFMRGYYTLAEAYEIFDQMHAMFPELITEKTPIGDFETHAGNPIYSLKISDNVNDDEEEPEVLYTAITHAREPGGLTQMIFYFWYLLENYGIDEEITYLVDNTEMYFIPVINPDGYLYNERTDPNGGGLWRKNRYANANGDTVGVDLNRNFGFEWGFDDIGSSTDEQSQTYRGEAPFSEPETQAVKAFCEAHEFQIALNYHTFGNLLIHPWGYNDEITEEDEIFKAFGEIMTEHNDYLIGTGTETVGYTVNGDSDDYMYGDTINKPKTYAFTPEVGPEFWAPQVMIDDINKYTLRENLNMAHLTLNYARAEEIDGDTEVAELIGAFQFDIRRYGLQEGTQTVKAVSLTPGLTLSGDEYTFDLAHLESDQFEITYSIDDAMIADEDKLEFEIQIDNGSLVISEPISKIFRTEGEMPVSILTYDNSSLDPFFINGDWGLTDEDFITAPTSISDSPNSDYENRNQSFIRLSLPIDLSNAEEAYVRFWSKWDIENDFDYVQLQASIDDQAFTPVCGLYTNNGTRNQDLDEPVFDGVQEEWVYEKMSLNEAVGASKVDLRFYMDTDNFVNGDGFYFDDFSVEIVEKEISNLDDNINVAVRVSPNPSVGMYEVILDPLYNIPANSQISIYDFKGQMVLSETLQQTNKLDLSSFADGSYVLKIATANELLFTTKLIKLNR